LCCLTLVAITILLPLPLLVGLKHAALPSRLGR